MASYGSEGNSELGRFLGVLRSRVWLIIATTLIFAGAAYGISAMQTPQYEASAQIVIDPQGAGSLFGSDNGAYRDPSRAIQTALQVIMGSAVSDAVRERVTDPASIDARAIGLTDSVEITATSNDPEIAAETANAYARAFIEYRTQQANDAVTTAEQEIQQKVTELQSQIDDLDAQIRAVGGFDLEGLVSRRDALIAQQALFNQRLDQMMIDASVQEDGTELVQPAEVPTSPASPRPLRNSLFGGLGGLFIGIAAAFVLERLDESIKTRTDVQEAVPGTAVLAAVPDHAGRRRHGDSTEASVVASTGPAAEAYRTLRTAVKFESMHRPLKTIQVTSALAAEGKSTTVANLAVIFAEAGERVVVVCCDLRRPRVHEFFGLDNDTGFTTALLETIDVVDVSQQVKDHPNLVLVASGPQPPNPSELLSSSAAEQVLTNLEDLADIVLIDSPPVLPVTDAAILAQHVDATILAVAAGRTTSAELKEAITRLRAVDAPLLGVVLNGVEEGSHYTSEYSQTRTR